MTTKKIKRKQRACKAFKTESERKQAIKDKHRRYYQNHRKKILTKSAKKYAIEKSIRLVNPTIRQPEE